MASYPTPRVIICAPENYNDRPRIRLDCSYLASTRGILKLFELIITAIAATLFFITSTFNYNINNTHPTGIHLNKDVRLAMVIGYVFYRLAPYVLGFSVKILLILYLFHVVEKYDKIPWYTIEFIVSGICAILSLACGISTSVLCGLLSYYAYPIDSKFILTAFLSYGAVILFVFDIVLVYLRKKMNQSPQE